MSNMTRAERTTAAQYDALAGFYDRYFSERLTAPRRGEYTRSASLDALLERLSATDISDCACGPGHLALELAHRGYRVVGTDISRAMIRIARRHAREFGSRARFQVCAWVDLPEKMRRRFDLVLCVGNAIGHCRNEREMVRALRAMHTVLRPGATLYLSTRWWERYRKARRRVDAFRSRVVDGERLVLLNVRHHAKALSDPHLIEVVALTIHEDNSASTDCFPVTYYPFRVADLRRRLTAAGFEQIAVAYGDGEWYQVTARRPA